MNDDEPVCHVHTAAPTPKHPTDDIFCVVLSSTTPIVPPNDEKRKHRALVAKAKDLELVSGMITPMHFKDYTPNPHCYLHFLAALPRLRPGSA